MQAYDRPNSVWRFLQSSAMTFFALANQYNSWVSLFLQKPQEFTVKDKIIMQSLPMSQQHCSVSNSSTIKYVHLMKSDSVKDYKANLNLVRNPCCDISTCCGISLLSKHAGVVNICDTLSFPSLWWAKIHISAEWRNSCWIQLCSKPFISKNTCH